MTVKKSFVTAVDPPGPDNLQEDFQRLASSRKLFFAQYPTANERIFVFVRESPSGYEFQLGKRVVNESEVIAAFHRTVEEKGDIFLVWDIAVHGPPVEDSAWRFAFDDARARLQKKVHLITDNSWVHSVDSQSVQGPEKE